MNRIGMSFRGIREGYDTFIIRLAHHAGRIVTELDRGSLHRFPTVVRDDHAIDTLIIFNGRWRCCAFGSRRGCSDEYINQLFILGQITRNTLDRRQKDNAVPVDKECRGEGGEVQLLIHIFKGQKIQILHVSLGKDFFTSLKFFVRVITDSDDSSVFSFCLNAACEVTELRHLGLGSAVVE